MLQVIFCFNLPGFGIDQGLFHCYEVEFLGGGGRLLCGIHAGEDLRGNPDGGVLGVNMVGDSLDQAVYFQCDFGTVRDQPSKEILL